MSKPRLYTLTLKSDGHVILDRVTVKQIAKHFCVCNVYVYQLIKPSGVHINRNSGMKKYINSTYDIKLVDGGGFPDPSTVHRAGTGVGRKKKPPVNVEEVVHVVTDVKVKC